MDEGRRKLDIMLDIAVLDTFYLDNADIGQNLLGHEKLDILVVLPQGPSTVTLPTDIKHRIPYVKTKFPRNVDFRPWGYFGAPGGPQSRGPRG